MKKPRQIEKDERFWVVAALMALHRAQGGGAVAKLLRRAFGDAPPADGPDTWEECFTQETLLFFEANLPSPVSYRKWLKDNISQRQIVPYVLDAASASGESLEGPTHVDAVLLNPTTGCAVLFEAKVLPIARHR
jgi:hypothetical protein